jgi:glycosyltransferase involved in cell wall biosynthesis
LDVLEVLAEHGAPMVETVQNTYAWFGDADWARERTKMQLLAGTVAVSDIVARYHARHTGEAPTCFRIPNAVDPTRAAAAPRGWARRRLDLPENAPVFVHHGRVARQKNLTGLVRAFGRVHRAFPGARLILAGPRSERAYAKEVRAVAPELFSTGAVRILPPVRHVGALLAAADAYVSDSFFEGWSVAASEAAWAGLPLILSDCGGSRELVGDDGARGTVVPNPVGDPLAVGPQVIRTPPAEHARVNEEALAGAMAQTIENMDHWRDRAEGMRSEARALLRPDAMAAAYASVYRQLAVTPR